MKTLNTRLRRLEDRLVPRVDEESVRLAVLVRERRRRRLEASGEPVEIEQPGNSSAPQCGFQTIAETLRSRFQQRSDSFR